MSHLKFNHVFLGLMALALISSFVLSPKMGDVLKGPAMGAFAPISYPASMIGSGIRNRVSPRVTTDIVSPSNPRDIDTVRADNQRLHVELLNLKAQLDILVEREHARSQLGELRNRCTPMNVIATDSGGRQSLILGGTSFAGLKNEMPVLYAGGIVGKLAAVGVGGARVTLITDPSFKAIVTFMRIRHVADGKLEHVPLLEPKLIEGRGDGIMTSRLTQDEISKSDLRKDDWVVLSDPDWPRELRLFRIGYVESIEPTRDPGFMLVTTRPDQDLMRLSEVMVMNKE